MIYMVHGGVRIDDDDWAGASPYVDTKSEHSAVTVKFKNGAEVTVTEDFLTHCQSLINHVRMRDKL